MKKSEILFTLLLVPLDFIALVGAFIFSYSIRQKINLDPNLLGSWSEKLQIDRFESLPPFNSYLNISLLFAFLIIVIFGLLGIYKIRSTVNSFQEIPKIIVAVSAGVSGIILLSFFLRTFLFPRLIILFFWILAVVIVSLVRLIIRLIQRLLFRFNIGITRVGILGNNGLMENTEKNLSNMQLQGFKISQIYHLENEKKLIKDIRDQKIDQLLVADTEISPEVLRELREECINSHVQFTYIPNLFDVTLANIEIKQLNGLPIVEVKPTPLDGWGRVIKRIVDLILSSLALIILSPSILIISLLIKIFTPGPVFFKHKRLGIAGKKIEIIKFRSMNYGWSDNDIVNNKSGLERFKEYLEKHPKEKKEWQEKQKLVNDPRISSLGRFLRSSHLDELPQFFNVLKGDLSLVGPRPIIEMEKSRYGEKSGRLFSIKPGITGLWQVSGLNDLTYDERIKLDVLYIENWNFWLDISIILKTINLFFVKKGAY